VFPLNFVYSRRFAAQRCASAALSARTPMQKYFRPRDLLKKNFARVEMPMDSWFLQRSMTQHRAIPALQIAFFVQACARAKIRTKHNSPREKFFAKNAVAGASSGTSRRKTRESVPTDSFWRPHQHAARDTARACFRVSPLCRRGFATRNSHPHFGFCWRG